ncbi:MAG: AEC family transporter [Verrucomicrobia bacterium]|nr:AEC family transporter [Verrucomicrobiota bacterium]
MQILNILAPVFLMIGLGAWLQRSGFVSPDFLKEANRVTYWLGLPALVFSQLASSVHELGGAQRVLVVMFAATGLSIAAGYLGAVLLRVPGGVVGTFVQASFRGNLAFVGLPIIYSFPDQPVASGVSLRTAAIVTVAPMMVFYNVAGVVVLLVSQHRFGWAMLKPLVRQLATNPPLLATVAGLTFAFAGWSLLPALDKTFTALGEMALPLGLLGVGGSLALASAGKGWRLPFSCAVIKTLVTPLLGWAVAAACGLAGLELKTVLILLACPTAVVSYTIALELKGDGNLASGAIVASVLTSLVSLALVIALA